MKRDSADDWKHAVAVDKAIRNVRNGYTVYAHPARIPLVDAVQIPEDSGYEQLDLLADAECDSGYCFL